MDNLKWPAVIGLVAGTVYLCATVPYTFAFDKPLLTASICLTTLGYVLVWLGSLRLKEGEHLHTDGQRIVLPWNIIKEYRASRHPTRPRDATHYSSLQRSRLTFTLLVAAICARVALFRAVLASVQCSLITLHPLVPLVLAVWRAWASRARSRLSIAENAGGVAYQSGHHLGFRQQFTRLLCVGSVSVGGIAAFALFRSPASTYICPTSWNSNWLTPFLQLVGTLEDVLLVHYCSHFLHDDDDGQFTQSMGSRLATLGKALRSAALWCAAALILETTVFYYFFAFKAERAHIFTISAHYVWNVLTFNIALSYTIVCAILLITQLDVVTTTLLPTFVSICAITTQYAWGSRLAFPPTHTSFGFPLLWLVTIGFGAYCYLETAFQDAAFHLPPLIRKITIWPIVLLLAILATQVGLWATESDSIVQYHPIDLLMFDAQAAHAAYAEQASSSHTLSEAVKTYRARYGTAPPPGFDHWYAYATARNSVIIDDFDRIHNDLRQFHALTPELIRRRTWEMLANPWHEVAGIIIRNGVATVAPVPKVEPNHMWMFEAAVSMIQPFAEWLPDMDLVFNLNDEPRVAQPYDIIHARQEQEPNSGQNLKNSFSDNRAQQWKPLSDTEMSDRLMIQSDKRRTFHEFGSKACPPASAAPHERLWDVQRLCTRCYEPHSIGPFLANWTLAADICHQPDLADLHGFYISPAAFKATDKLYPIFSQSKAHGYSDILYPSPWNYIKKTKYEPNEDYPDVAYANKNHQIYWRGSTTEGLSHGYGQWKGMARQRFIHLTSPHQNSSAPQALLIPTHDPDSPPKHKYTSVPITELKKHIATDIRFVAGGITRCGGADCATETREFSPLAPRAEFQESWQYKFLLDMDGAGFSGRFIPFLKSRCLPFKAALYREWWDDRVTAWQHFVPLDLRGHGFWATLAYFAGFEGRVGGKAVKVEAREGSGQRIAENGRDWAFRVLRNEDQEIYMFRLLLEWGRLTDDRREEIGFEIPAQ